MMIVKRFFLIYAAYGKTLLLVQDCRLNLNVLG